MEGKPREGSGFTLFLTIVGGGLGALATVGQLVSGEGGRVYLFLPTIIFAVIGGILGTGIDKVVFAIRKSIARSRDTSMTSLSGQASVPVPSNQTISGPQVGLSSTSQRRVTATGPAVASPEAGNRSATARGELRRFALSAGTRSENAETEYDQWRVFCLDLAETQQIPARLVYDLIPPKEIADHSLKDLAIWEDLLEAVMPGRRQWLLDERVRRGDSDAFWSRPSWVQNFIEKLSERHLELEYRGQKETGADDSLSALATVFFIPRFAVAPPSDFDPALSALPFELFDRVQRYLASLDSVSYQREAVGMGCRTANAYVREKIRRGEI